MNLPSTEEVKEAIEHIKTTMPYLKGDAHEQHYKTLLSLAIAYLSAPDDKIQWMKKTSVEELKEIILDTFVKEKLWNATQDLISTILAQAVSDMLNGGGE